MASGLNGGFWASPPRPARVPNQDDGRAGELFGELERGKPGPSQDGKTRTARDTFSPYRQALDASNATRQDVSRWQRFTALPESE